ncbi:ankyrin repeat domain-containing protein 34A [Cuculus canorus]|uniref:ankyrin repeat domain-containing protein 34A n=1 Tax=Cuculus canorus TaxID=55661 RepID=UPI0023AA8561|nr:ankyrin repeat domain-containing protein 34A [Cuculus canorus]
MPSPVRRPVPSPALASLPSEGSALQRAAAQGKFRLARLLLEGGAYVNEGDGAGQTPLMAACRAAYAEQPRMVRYLLENGADPNIPDKAGKTALMHACAERAGPAVAAVLLAHGADPSARDHAGASALVYALNGGDRETLRVLLDACKARGKDVIIITTATSPSGTKTTRHYLNSPPSPGAEEKRSPMSPSDIEVRTAASPAGSEKDEERDVFRFPMSSASRRRPLQRLNSEPWGLAAREGPRAAGERLAAGVEALGLGARPRRHSVESREATDDDRVPNAPPRRPAGARWEREGNPCAVSAKAPPQRRGSGTFPLEPGAPGRAGFLPPLPPAPLLRRHSMQTEEMRLLAHFQSVPSSETGT